MVDLAVVPLFAKLYKNSKGYQVPDWGGLCPRLPLFSLPFIPREKKIKLPNFILKATGNYFSCPTTFLWEWGLLSLQNTVLTLGQAERMSFVWFPKDFMVSLSLLCPFLPGLCGHNAVIYSLDISTTAMWRVDVLRPNLNWVPLWKLPRNSLVG